MPPGKEFYMILIEDESTHPFPPYAIKMWQISSNFSAGL